MALTKATLIDLNSNELILDLDADTSITADTDDTIHFKIAGADELVMTGTALTPAVADGSALGSTSLEWSDIFLADGAVINFGSDQDVTLTHVADSGLALKSVATADDKPVTLVLQTGETDIAANDVLGVLNFQAPDEGTGTDAILVAAGIAAVSEGDFSASANATKLSFRTAASAAASETMSLTSNGDLFLAGGLIDLKNDGNAVSQIKFYCESSNAHAQTLIGAPHSESATNTLTLPSTGGDSYLVTAASTATLTNKTLTAPVINSPTGDFIKIAGTNFTGSLFPRFTILYGTFDELNFFSLSQSLSDSDGFFMTEIIPSTISSTCVKSRLCSPSPVIVNGSSFLYCSKNIGKTVL